MGTSTSETEIKPNTTIASADQSQIEDENLVGKENGTTDAQAMVAAQQKMNESEKREAGE